MSQTSLGLALSLVFSTGSLSLQLVALVVSVEIFDSSLS